MSTALQNNDVVWWQNRLSKLWPAKICPDPSTGEWIYHNEVFIVPIEPEGPISDDGHWVNKSDVAVFERIVVSALQLQSLNRSKR